MALPIKQEKFDLTDFENQNRNVSLTRISSSLSDSSRDSSTNNEFSLTKRKSEVRGSCEVNMASTEIDGGAIIKKPKLEDFDAVVPPGFLAPLAVEFQEETPVPEILADPQRLCVTVAEPLSQFLAVVDGNSANPATRSCKQFWKAGDYEGGNGGGSVLCSVGMDHVRVHPKFLHSNATSHKWALGAFAELLDNALDEVCSGATYVHIEVIHNKKDNSNMLLVEDNGGGMTPDRMRLCMSLGYSTKSKFANTIGQYGNGFKTSTMRLGADVIVFSRCRGDDGKRPTQSIGMLSYTFLRDTGKEDIVVPMIDFEKRVGCWDSLIRSSQDDWNRNLETIAHWSPYMSKNDLVQQFDFVKDQGTRIIIYNLWEDEEGNLELDFDTDPQDIQIRGVNRDEKNIQMAKKYPNSRHFLTYRHSLRSYASILYLRLPRGFKIILRDKEVEHHNLVNDMMLTKEITYRPQQIPGEMSKNSEVAANLTIGFVKDAEHHIDVQGFNVYHKNRLIKPFWRLWNAAGSDGRGVIGVLEANFVEPAHDKQGFERTIVLSRLEARLIQYQKNYWSTNCQQIGYAPRRHVKSPDPTGRQRMASNNCKTPSPRNQNGHGFTNGVTKMNSGINFGPSPLGYVRENGSCDKASPSRPQPFSYPQATPIILDGNCQTQSLITFKQENLELGESSQRVSRFMMRDMLSQLQYEKVRCRQLEIQLQEAREKQAELEKKVEIMDGEQVALINIIESRDQELREKSREDSEVIEELRERVRELEAMLGAQMQN